MVPHTPSLDFDDSANAFTRVDGLGALTGLSGLVLFNFAWNQAPVVGWQDPYIYIVLIIGLLFLAVFGYVKSKLSKFPLVPLEVTSSGVGFVLIRVGLFWSSYNIWIFYSWQFRKELRGVSALVASTQFSVVAVSGFCAAIIAGFLMS